MFELHQLEQLIAVAECGTLSQAAGKLHISQPALSRSIQKLESELQAELFLRSKNKIELNDNGKLAVECARKVVGQAEDMVEQVRSYDRNQRTIFIGSCAPAPLWELSPVLSSLYPDKAISTEMKEPDQLLQGLMRSDYQIIILPEPVESDELYCTRWGEEHLMFSLPPAHPLSGSKALHLKDMDGETMLLFSRIGFWQRIPSEKMTSSHFLVQQNTYDFEELIRHSALPYFSSDLAVKQQGPEPNRIFIPILDPEANITYYLAVKKQSRKKFSALFQRIRRSMDNDT